MNKIIFKFILVICLFQPIIALAKADLSNFIVIGDSVAAGYQNGQLTNISQQNSFPLLIAQQANVNFIQPSLVSPPPPVPNNLAVPGERVCDTLSLQSVATNPLAALYHPIILGSNNTQVSLAVNSMPTTLLIEIGANDVLLHAIFKENIVLSTISSLTGLPVSIIRQGLAANDPNLINLATFISVQISANPSLKDIFLTSDDANVPNSFPVCYHQLMAQVNQITSKPTVVISNIPNAMTSPYINLLINEGILNNYDISQMTSRIKSFNQIISDEASTNGAALINAFDLSTDLAAKGYVVAGDRLNNGFYCGLYSLDGVHPTNTLDGILANSVIRVLNTEFSAGIPPIAISQIAKVDPLINLPLCASPTHPARSFNSPILDAISSMTLF